MMTYREIGTSGIQASVVGLGTWAIGGWMWGGTDERESIQAIQAGLEAGINLVDTAPVYGFGRSEEIVAKAIRGRRDQVVLATKCGLLWDRQEGEYFFTSDENSRNDGGQYKIYKCLAPASIRQELEASLLRLQVDTIDLYQTHWQTETTAVQETMEELLALKAEGKIRAIGISNATVEILRRYQALGEVDAVQEKYSMLDRERDKDILPACADGHLAFLAYSPIGQGLLTGKLGPERTFSEGDLRATRDRFSVENRKRIQQMLDACKSVAEKHEISMAQMAIAWAVHQPGCTHALVGARNPRQAIENAKAGSVHLDASDLAIISNAVSTFAQGI